MSNPYTIAKKCKLSQGFLPSFTPEIYNISKNTSVAGTYSVVFIVGKNFLPNGTTYVNFGNNYQNISVSYFSSYNISFVVPTNAIIGSYDIVVVNNYNSNFSSNTNNFYNSNLNYSNSETYTLI
jgi:hypothetical protein